MIGDSAARFGNQIGNHMGTRSIGNQIDSRSIGSPNRKIFDPSIDNRTLGNPIGNRQSAIGNALWAS